jgi:hypothetical protein
MEKKMSHTYLRDLAPSEVMDSTGLKKKLELQTKVARHLIMKQACHVGPWEFQRFVQGDRPSQGYQGILSSGLRKRQNCFPALGLGTLEPDDCSVGWKELLLLALVFRA